MIIIISFVSGLLVFCIAVMVFYPYGISTEEVKARINTIAKLDQREIIIDGELDKPIVERILKPFIQNFKIRLRKRFAMISGTDSENPKAAAYRKKLRQAGIMMNPAEYRILQTIVSVGVIVLFAAAAYFYSRSIKITGYSAVFGIYTSYAIFRFRISSRTSKRRDNIRQQLPEILDMLSVSVEAGLGLDQAILHVIDHFKGPLVDELNIAYREMTLGRSRRDALIGLGDRCEVEEVKTFVRAINQASQLGISIKNVLRSQSAFIRQSRRNKIEEKAQKVPVKILLPMTVFIFPVMFIVLLGPAAVKLYNIFM